MVGWLTVTGWVHFVPAVKDNDNNNSVNMLSSCPRDSHSVTWESVCVRVCVLVQCGVRDVDLPPSPVQCLYFGYSASDSLGVKPVTYSTWPVSLLFSVHYWLHCTIFLIKSVKVQPTASPGSFFFLVSRTISSSPFQEINIRLHKHKNILRYLVALHRWITSDFLYYLYRSLHSSIFIAVIYTFYVLIFILKDLGFLNL